MKTSVLKYLKMTLLAAMIVNLSACEVEIGGFWEIIIIDHEICVVVHG